MMCIKVFIIYLTYTSIALDTRLLAKPYRPSQIELSSPAIQKSCRGLIPADTGANIFVPPSPAVDLALEKKLAILQINCKNKKSGHILTYFT